jgi:hypothetical protein
LKIKYKTKKFKRKLNYQKDLLQLMQHSAIDIGFKRNWEKMNKIEEKIKLDSFLHL